MGVAAWVPVQVSCFFVFVVILVYCPLLSLVFVVTFGVDLLVKDRHLKQGEGLGNVPKEDTEKTSYAIKWRCKMYAGVWIE